MFVYLSEDHHFESNPGFFFIFVVILSSYDKKLTVDIFSKINLMTSGHFIWARIPKYTLTLVITITYIPPSIITFLEFFKMARRHSCDNEEVLIICLLYLD